MLEGDVQKLQKKVAYLSAQLEQASQDQTRLDMLNLVLTRQKKQAIVTFDFIKIIQEKVEKALSVDDLYIGVVKTINSDMSIDYAALLTVNLDTKDLSVLVSSPQIPKIKNLQLDEKISEQEILASTFLSSASTPRPFHEYFKKVFELSYFVWYPISNQENNVLVLFVGNKNENLFAKHPFSEISVKAFGAITSAIVLRRENIIKTQQLREKLNELEKFYQLSVGRELKMVELKEEIDILKNK